MLERAIDLWSPELDAHVRCITTNGTVTENGENVMGGGCAREAAERWSQLPRVYGNLIRNYGHILHVVYSPALTRQPWVLFPVKHTISDRADPALIEKSTHELIQRADFHGWQQIALPQPGCGLGGLSWDDIHPFLASVLDDRFTAISYPAK